MGSPEPATRNPDPGTLNRKKPVSYIAIVLGAVIFVVGLVFTGMYVVDGVIATRGEADQSPVFWYLPILFLGLAGMGLGARLLYWGRKSLAPDD